MRALPKAREHGMEPGMELRPLQKKGQLRKRDGGKEPPQDTLTHVKPSRTRQAIFSLHSLEKPRAA